MNTETIITVQRGQEYQPRVECIYPESNFFYTSYKRAASGLYEILAATEHFCERYENEAVDYWTASSACLNTQLLGYPNNVLAFCADRGQGKTSAMISFASALAKLPRQATQDSEARARLDDFWNGPLAARYRYETIDYIDPTTMEGNESILQVILSRMFSHFREKADIKRLTQDRYGRASESSSFTIQRKELLKQFRECFHSLELLKGGRRRDQDEDDLEQIMALGDSSNLRGMLFQLVRCYLDFVTGSSDSFLILQIDDADLNIDQAYAIVEDIRKYFIMPNVIVLMAVNMQQMESTVEQYFLNKYKTELSQKGGMVDVETCHDIAERYIDKVLPGARQIELPKLNLLLREDFHHIQIVYESVDPRTGEKEPLLAASDASGSWHFQEQLLHLLHQKTGMVFLAPDDGRHPLLPGTMRELTHFLNYFCSLPDVQADYAALVSGGKSAETGIRSWLRGVERLEHYLMDIWGPINLPEEARSPLSLLSREAYSHKHELLLRFLSEYYGHEMENVGFGRGISTQKAEYYRKEFIERCQESGIFTRNREDPTDISYAGVCEALYILEELPGNGRQYRFAYAIRLYYSICMHKLLLSKWPEKDVYQELSVFLGDVFFKPSRVNDPPFGRFTLNGAVLAKLLAASNLLSNQTVQTAVAALCRWKDPTVREQKMCPVLTSDSTEEFQEQLKRSELVFDALFPVYHTLDILSLAGNPDTNEQTWLAGSLCILLNWDVQNSLRKCVAQTAESDWLSHWLKHLYGDIKTLFETVTYTACPAKLSEQTLLGDVAGDANGVFFAIQISYWHFFQDYFDNITSLLESIPDLVDSPGSAASPAGTDELKDKLSGLTRKAAALADLAGACRLSLEYIPQKPDGEWSLKELSERLSALLRDISTNGFMNPSHFVGLLAELIHYLRAYQEKLEALLHTYTEEQKVETGPETAPSSPPASSEAAAANGDGAPRPGGAGQETNPAGGYAASAGLPD